MGNLPARLERKQTSASTLNSPGPSKLLMGAAISGLLGVNNACKDDPPAEQIDPQRREDAGPMECEPAGGSADAGQDAGADADASVDPAAEIDKEIRTTNVQHTFAELTALCDERKGYVEVLGSCSGVNTCKGFTYGDWGEDSQLLEHTCSGSNGCAGLSCLIPAREGAAKEMTGEEIIKLDDAWFEERVGTYGAKPCRTCHIESEHNDATGDYDYDYTKLRVHVRPGSGRNENNWTQRSTAYQEKVVAFGSTHIADDGAVITGMVSYAKLFSKEEIRSVVEYMRKYDPKNIVLEELVLDPGKKD